MDKEQLNQLAKFLQETAESGRDFFVEQAPLIATEMLQWRYYQDVMGILICAIIAIVLYLIGRRINNIKRYREWLEGGGDVIPLHAIPWALVIAPFIVSCCLTFDAVKCRVAPRLVLIEEVKDLIAPVRR